VEEATEYLRHANECLEMAHRARGDRYEELIRLAEAWLRLAEERLETVRAQPASGDAQPAVPKDRPA
jgi:hypothetical protein